MASNTTLCANNVNTNTFWTMVNLFKRAKSLQ